MQLLPSTTTSIIYKATVIGAGPAGLACVGNLLDRINFKKNEFSNDRDHEKGGILWIDPQFRAGRLSSYLFVPSNTKVCLFIKYAQACQSLNSEASEILHRLKNDFDGQKGCELRWAGELCTELTELVRSRRPEKELKFHRGTVKEMKFIENDNEQGNYWELINDDGSIYKSKIVFLTTGSHPKTLTFNSEQKEKLINLDDALNPKLLKTLIKPSDSVAVYGSSHSAMLVLKNLLDNNDSSFKEIKVFNFYRQEPKFAEFPDPINHPDRILHDNTGLKGEVSDWVRTWCYLSDTELETKFQGRLCRINNSHRTAEIAAGKLAIDKVICAVGYERNELPKIIYKQQKPITNPNYTSTGQLLLSSGAADAVDGLFGFGIAFPERVEDLDGAEEAAVGLWKFMRHIKKSINSIIL